MPHRSGTDATSEDLIAGARTTFPTTFSGVLTIEVEGADSIHIDGRGERCVATRVAPPEAITSSHCTWRTDGETLMRIFRGARAFESAYLSGRLHISGDMAIMLRLQMERAPSARMADTRGQWQSL